MKNPADIFEYFKHYSRDLEAHGSRHLAVCFGEDISDTQIQIQVSHHFGSSVSFYFNWPHSVLQVLRSSMHYMSNNSDIMHNELKMEKSEINYDHGRDYD